MEIQLIHEGEGKFRFSGDAPSSGSHLEVGAALSVTVDPDRLLRYRDYEIDWTTRCMHMSIAGIARDTTPGKASLQVYNEDKKIIGMMYLHFDSFEDMDPFLTDESRIRAFVRADITKRFVELDGEKK